MSEPGDRNGQAPRRPQRDDTTLRDGELTNTLARRLRQEVERERASQGTLADPDAPDSRVPVVVDPDGTPRAGEDAEMIPESAIVEVQDAPPPPRKPPPLPARKR